MRRRAPGDPFVVAHEQASVDLKAKADLLLTHQVVSFNGNDAIGLAYDDPEQGTILVDAVGTDGADPGGPWAVAGVAGATADHTLIRKPEVALGTLDWALSAGTSAADSQWVVHPSDYFDDLGLPQASCVPLGADCAALGAECGRRLRQPPALRRVHGPRGLRRRRRGQRLWAGPLPGAGHLAGRG